MKMIKKVWQRPRKFYKQEQIVPRSLVCSNKYKITIIQEKEKITRQYIISSIAREEEQIKQK